MNESKGSAKKDNPKTSATPKASKGNSQEVVFTFKSKFRNDKVLLDPGYKRENKDGSKSIKSDVWAEFSYNTWSTGKPTLAKMLRDKIEEFKDVDPLHIMETTNL